MSAEPSGDSKPPQSKSDPETVSDRMDGTLLSSGEVIYNGRSHQLLLTQKGLQLVAAQAESQAGADGANVAVVDVPWREVVCACEPPVKKSKTVGKDNKAEMGDSAASKVFVVHYMIRNAKTNKVQCKSVTLQSTQETAEGWIMQIEEKRKEGKPQKLLIIVNPIGGNGNARQLLQKRVQPLFALAGVELVVKVSERSQHAIEIAKTFDVASVDGVIVMGGDGLYMEVLHGLTVRKQEEEGVDYNDPEATLVPPTVRVGIIPAGSGNGMTTMFNGVMDVETATLNIIRGELDRSNIFAIHEGRKLVRYAGLLYANGFFSSLIKRTDELRWMKKARYLYVMGSHVFGKKKTLEYEVEVLKGGQDQSDMEDNAKAEGAEAAAASDWQKLGTKRATAIFGMTSRLTEGPEDLLVMNPFRPACDLLLIDNASALDNIRFLFGFATRKRSAFVRPNIETVTDIHGARFHLVRPKTEGAESSRQQREIDELCRILDVDGEVVTLSEPDFEVRLHSQFLQVFSYPDHFNKVTPPS